MSTEGQKTLSLTQGSKEKIVFNIPNLEIGDKLVIHQGLWSHVAVIIGPDMVLQNTRARGEHCASIAEFSEGKPFHVVKTDVAASVVIARARAILANPKPYSLLFRNCEDTVNEVLSGKAESPQVQGGIVLTFCVVGIFLLAGKSK